MTTMPIKAMRALTAINRLSQRESVAMMTDCSEPKHVADCIQPIDRASIAPTFPYHTMVDVITIFGNLTFASAHATENTITQTAIA